jgi:dUTP pyrophosphatase
MIDVGVYAKPEVPLPSFGSDLASCFDLAYHNPEARPIIGYDSHNYGLSIDLMDEESKGFYFRPNTRLLIPTGLIFDFPQGFDMRVHPRSGVSLKQGLTLINCEGVIDEDYTNELFIPMINLSSRSVLIEHGMRLAQAEICGTKYYGVIRITHPNFVRLDKPPSKKANRTGGFGSTGTS